ncbi:MAG: aminotransferase class I/II-fold pyridoxal phosphate-dependent enzyme [Candidatus Thermoplasmatota archaeon]|nr:aminotransferase class I/II-fold pyridoxal phosphate-dependent enzyme [Candidatus Thermoplasmatota archaeon]
MSGLRKMFDLVTSDTVNLGLGEPDFQPPKEAIEAVEEAMRLGFNKYGPTNGIPALREDISNRLKVYWKDVAPENVIVTSSGSEALFSGFLTFMDHGQKALVPDPGFVLYRPHSDLTGGGYLNYDLSIDNEFRPDPDAMEKLIDDTCKVLVVNSPSNPTGGMVTRQDRDDIVDVAREHDLIIISDEVYDTMVYTGNTHYSFLGAYEKTMMVNSFSKIFAMTGWRIGYLAAPLDMVQKIGLAHYHMVACPSTPAQYGALAALRKSGSFLTDMVAEFEKRRDIIHERINEIPGFRAMLPRGTFYSFPSYELFGNDGRVRSQDLAMELARNGLICSPGTTFGENGEYHLRFSFVNSRENIEKGMDILQDVAGKFRKSA